MNNLQQNYLENDNISDRYTLKDFKSRFSIFPEGKEFYGISAQGWQGLVDKLNNQ